MTPRNCWGSLRRSVEATLTREGTPAPAPSPSAQGYSVYSVYHSLAFTLRFLRWSVLWGREGLGLGLGGRPYSTATKFEVIEYIHLDALTAVSWETV